MFIHKNSSKLDSSYSNHLSSSHSAVQLDKVLHLCGVFQFYILFAAVLTPVFLRTLPISFGCGIRCDSPLSFTRPWTKVRQRLLRLSSREGNSKRLNDAALCEVHWSENDSEQGRI